MLNKILFIFILVFCFNSLVAIPCFGLMEMRTGAVSSLSSTPGIGIMVDLELPYLLVPHMTTKFEMDLLRMGTSDNYYMLPILLTETFNFSGIPYYAGFGAGFSLFSNPTTVYSTPTSMLNAIGYIGYKFKKTILGDLFVQAGVLGNYSTYNVDDVQSTSNGAWFEVKAGTRFDLPGQIPSIYE